MLATLASTGLYWRVIFGPFIVTSVYPGRNSLRLYPGAFCSSNLRLRLYKAEGKIISCNEPWSSQPRMPLWKWPWKAAIIRPR